MAESLSPNRSPDPGTNPFILLYIAGFGRSGSTLLERLLAQVEGFIAIGEGRHLWKRGLLENQRCSCGAPFLECTYWSPILDNAFEGFDQTWAEQVYRHKNSVDRYRYIPLMVQPGLSPAYTASVKDYTGLLAKFYREIHTQTGARVIVDSSKDPSYAYLLSTIPDIPVRFIHLTRDSRGVAYSWKKVILRPEITSSQVLMPRYSLLRSALAWNTNNIFSEMLRLTPAPYVRVRYEDLVDMPQITLQKVISFAGAGRGTIPEFPSDRPIELHPYHTISGNPLRFKEGSLELRMDKEWIYQMRPWEKSLVTALTSPLLLRYGYSLAGEAGHMPHT